jgi:hypothetical protein
MDGEAFRQLLGPAGVPALCLALMLGLGWYAARDRRQRRKAQDLHPLLAALQEVEHGMQAMVGRGPAASTGLMTDGGSAFLRRREPGRPATAHWERPAEASQWHMATRR